MQVHYLRVLIVTKQSIHQKGSEFSGGSCRYLWQRSVTWLFGRAWINAAGLQEQLE